MNGFDSQLALMAVGWLAREDKISINRNLIVGLSV